MNRPDSGRSRAGPIGSSRCRGLGWALWWAWVALAWLPIDAEPLRYAIEIPDGQSIRYEIELDVIHPGELAVRAEWSGPRVLAFRIEPAQELRQRVQRRSGVSPQEMRVTIDERAARSGPWRLSLSGLPMRGAGSGTLEIELPAPPQVIADSALPPPPTGAPAPAAWRLPLDAPRHLSRREAAYHQDVERFRDLVVDEAGAPMPDPCRWQEELLQFLVGHRDLGPVRDRRLDPATRKLLEQIVRAVEQVEALRGSDDPALVGPVPRDRGLRRSWTLARAERMLALESELDQILRMTQTDQVSQLAEQTWPERLVSCIVGCERFFDERAEKGEQRAPNRDLARTTWPSILAAQRALARLTSDSEARQTRSPSSGANR